MPQIAITLSDAQHKALLWAEVDPVQLAQSQFEGRANQAMAAIVDEEIKRLRTAGEPIPATDEEIVLAAPIKTVKQRQEEAEAAQQINQPPPQSEADSQKVAVLSHALALKIGAVNAMRPNEPPYPISQDVLTEVRERYRDIATSLTAKTAMGVTLSEVEKATLANIQTGFAYFEAVNQAADTILAAGDPADPIVSDARWPTLG